MLLYLALELLFASFVVCNNVTSSTTTLMNNQTLISEHEKLETFSPLMDIAPAFNYHTRTPFPYYYPNKGLYNPRNTALQFPSDHFPYVYDANPSVGGHSLIEHETESSLKPSARHFVIVSFIGLLLLFAVIQNTIEATKRKTALVEVLSSRKKRDLTRIRQLSDLTPEEEGIFNDDARLRCLQWMVCLQNRKLLQDFGASGELFAKYLTRYIKKVLSSTQWGPLVEDAGITGYRNGNCDILYHDCK